MFCTTQANGYGSALPEVPINVQRFPLRPLQRLPWCYSPQQQQHQHPQFEQLHNQQQQQHSQIGLRGKFPLLDAKCENHLRRFPLRQIRFKDALSNNSHKLTTTATPRFPEQMIHLTLPQRFPLSCQLPKRNFSYSLQSISKRGCSPSPMPESRCATLKQFPAIKKQFVSFSDNRPQTCRNQHGNVDSKEATDVLPTPATVTQTSHKMITKIDIDMDSNMDVNAYYAHNVDDDLDVHKAVAFDNELNACEQTLNLNVEPAEGVVGEQKEIEHQQAENFNDAFGWRFDNDNDNEGNDDVGSAKNKREICEQSKLETTTATPTVHNELNMTKEQQQPPSPPSPPPQQQSIRLASEQEIQTIAERTTNAFNRQSSDARGSSSEQVDGQEQQPNLKLYVTQTENEEAASSIKILECAARELLDKATSSSLALVVDLDLIDLLGDLVQLIATPTSTGNFWSVPLVEEQVVVDECADMTVTKVSDDSETATAVVADIYTEQIEQQPAELDDNNNNNRNNNTSNSNSKDMKYEVLKSSTRLPETLTSRLSSTAAAAPTSTTLTTATVAPVSSFTSRIPDVTTTPTTSTSTRPLLGELKRTSSSRDAVSIDVESLLPARTLLRRQRRMRSQESVEETPEDVIARLNKLKERISGALNEVKGVLKQYSTETEAETEGQKLMGPSGSTSTSEPSVAATETKAEKQPVLFRFVKKVRRRSYFDEEEEEKEKANDAPNLSKTDVPTKEIELQDAAAVEASTKPFEEQNKLAEVEAASASKVNEEQKKISELNEDPKYPKVKSNETATHEEKPLQAPKALEDPMQAEQVPSSLKVKPIEKPKAQAKLEFLAKVQSELKSKPKAKESPVPKELSAGEAKELTKNEVATSVKQPATTAITEQPQPMEAVEAAPPTAALPKESATQPATAAEPKPTTVTKKKIIVKKNTRRASIAAVEPSKIKTEPLQIDALIQRRPSDTEAIVKRKKKQKLTASGETATASGSNERRQLQQQQQEVTTINEQVVTAKVNNNATTAKSVTATAATTAKSVKQTAVPTAAAAATTTAATTLIEATATTLPTAPKQSLIDDVIAKQAAASEPTRRASLKLAELVGETVLVVPAATQSAQDIKANSIAAEISTSLSQSKKPINQTAIKPPQQQEQQQQVVAAVDIEVAPVAATTTTTTTTQIAATFSEVSHEKSSPQQQQEQLQQQQQPQDQLATKDNAQSQENNSLSDMPELKVLTGPVQPVKIETVEQPHDESDCVVAKKKSPHLKKLVRKTSIDKGKEKVLDAAKLSSLLKDKNKIANQADRINKLTPPKKQSKPTEAKDKADAETAESLQQENAEVSKENTTDTQLELELEPQPEPEPKPKKPRQIKKKVIIKRQKRKLSIGDTFFIQQEQEEPKVPEIETIEKAIAYVTDDEDDVEPEPVLEPTKQLKSCLHVREYKIGDLVLYAERYRKTQVRWKRGRVLERITGISYKLDIEGKEVAAHISYIKKYTGRKVKFVGKEYLDIEYEQVVEEERRARSYSIWNMV